MTEVDILGTSDRRRIWSAEEKAALLAEIDAEGGRVRLVARRRGVSESLLYNWRSAQGGRRGGGCARRCSVRSDRRARGQGAARTALLAPPEPTPAPEPLPTAGTGGSIEITLPNGARVSVDASVNEHALSRVLRVMKGMA